MGESGAATRLERRLMGEAWEAGHGHAKESDTRGLWAG
jgi:hypothetical protein